MKTGIAQVIFFVLLAFAANAQSDVQARLDALMREALEKDVFSGHVAVFQNGQPVFDKSIGMADYERQLPNTAETRFAIGSITKLFTKILVLQLAAEGKIALHDKLGKYLDGFRPELAEKVSIAHLLDHQSGLGQYYDLPDFAPEAHPVASASDFLPWIRQEPLQFEPGARAEYSNSGYILLAAIVEKVTVKNYAEALKERIFDKIGMNATAFQYRVAEVPGKATGYLANMPGPRRSNLDFPLLGGGDGGIYTTSGDLQKLDRSLSSDNQLLPDHWKLRLFNEPLFPRQYASWEEFEKEGKFALAGGGPGVSAVYSRNFPKNRLVFVLSNYDEGSAEMIFQRIGAILNDQAPAPLQPSASKFIYNLLKEKGAAHFSENIENELTANGYSLEDDMVLFFAGQALLEEKEADKAVALYEFYTRKFPRIVVAWNDLGDAWLLKGATENAKKCFRKALELRPGSVRAKESLEKL